MMETNAVNREAAKNEKATKFAKYQPLVQKYLEILDKADITYQKACIKQAFDELSTDFERVCFILKALEAFNQGKHGMEFLGLPSSMKGLVSGNLKSDMMANYFLHESFKLHMEMNELGLAFSLLNRAYFYAESDRVKARVLLNRSHFLYRINCFRESLRDATGVLKFELLQSEKMEIYATIARCYVKEDCPVEAAEYFQKAFQCMDSRFDFRMKQLFCNLQKEFLNIQYDSLVSRLSRAVAWKGSYPLPPQTLNRPKIEEDAPLRNKKKRKKTRKAVNLDTQVKLFSVKDGILKLRNTQSERGWTLEASKDISVGDVLAAERPYASVQISPRTNSCYYCYRKCLNIQPCSGCAQVGFCSEKCSEDARNPAYSINGGPGRHRFDCAGLLPCLQLDDLFENSEKLSEDTFFSHLAYTCIANTPPKTLLDYLCSTGRYKKSEARHPGFIKDGTDGLNPPLELNPSDYSSIAWSDAESKKFTNEELWQLAVKAVFLTYCLSLCGYPMKWFDEEKNNFYKSPSSTNRPVCIPASWIGACMLYHLKAVRFNTVPHVALKRLSGKITYAHCIYPTISLINHSCNPSAALVNTAFGGVYVYAVRSIRAGEEISIPYGPYFANRKAEERKSFLKKRFRFDCSCEACCNKWLERDGVELIKCPSCRHFNISGANKCSRCKDRSGSCIYKLLMENDMHLLSDCVNMNGWSSKNVFRATAIVEQFQAILRQPSRTLSTVTQMYADLVEHFYGVITFDPI
nr:hypothetical transcript [Hymenolepis microstoma]